MRNIFLFIKVFCLICIVTIMLYTRPIPEILKLLTPVYPPKLKKWDMEKIVRLADFFFFWRIPFFRRGACLKKSLILYKFLRENGVDVEINIGVKKDSKKIRGHAWLTLNNKPYLTQPGLPEGFTLCYVFPS